MMPTTAIARLSGDRSQQVFDALLRALAEPGTVRHLPDDLVDPGIPVSAWLALALGDVDVDVCIGDDSASDAAQLVHDATGARLVDLDEAWVASFETITPDHIDRIAVGSALEPEAGARVCIRVDSITVTPDSAASEPRPGGVRLRLTGPGVPVERHVDISGLDPLIAARLGRASGVFPAGFDTWLITAGGAMIAIPRSTHVDLLDDDSTVEVF